MLNTLAEDSGLVPSTPSGQLKLHFQGIYPLLAITSSNMPMVYINLSRYIHTQKFFFKTKILKTNILIIVNILISYLLKRFILSAQEKDSRDISTNHHNMPWSSKMMDQFFFLHFRILDDYFYYQKTYLRKSWHLKTILFFITMKFPFEQPRPNDFKAARYTGLICVTS